MKDEHDVVDAPDGSGSPELMQDVLRGLRATEKYINPKWLYDSTGSALFEQITELPEYYLTRTETRILRENAGRLAGLVPEGGALVEFGSGASIKTRILLDSATHLNAYVPIDISSDFLHATAADLRGRYPPLLVQPVVGDFLHPVKLPEALSDVPKVTFFPGSTLGNLIPADARLLLTRTRLWSRAEAFILGVDLVKDPRILESAYDDSAGVTEKFISNVLVRLNREAGANFDLSRFRYEAKWNADLAQIEMSLISSKAQSVSLGGVDITFRDGEKIAVSQSRKYTLASIQETAAACGWKVDELITDTDELFAVAVLKGASGPA